ncbi:hypothetical protein FG386_002330 [Cryptosporidium ryanae]|uniref:uncharacterized protein n=1 Tax=Cryptosporidium ryanae TaxID=515981 RepID=UPI003519DE6B|nr:hypothetical protein FG386_002330 [Cryptosporidium ryanae]
MFLKILKLTPMGGGPAPLLKNQIFKQCYSLMFLNIFIAAWSISSILYSKFTNANFGPEISAYLFIVFIMGSINSVYFSKLGSLRYCSDDEWSKKLITILAINLLQYGAVVWGCWILYRVFMSRRAKDENRRGNTRFNNDLKAKKGIYNNCKNSFICNKVYSEEFQFLGDIHNNLKQNKLYEQIRPLETPFNKEKVILNNISKSSIRSVELIGRKTQVWGGRVTENGIVDKEDLPEWLNSICKSLVKSNIFSEENTPNHVLINQYDINGGIMPHKDGPLYHPKVAIISLESDTVFDFWKPSVNSDSVNGINDKPIFSLIVPRFSLLVFQDQCYTDLLHGISSRLVSKTIFEFLIQKLTRISTNYPF